MGLSNRRSSADSKSFGCDETAFYVLLNQSQLANQLTSLQNEYKATQDQKTMQQ